MLSISVLSVLLLMTISQRESYYNITLNRVFGSNKLDSELKVRFEMRNQRIREACKRIIKKDPVFVTYDNSSEHIEGMGSSPFIGK